MEQLRTWFALATSGPTYAPDAADRADLELVGLAFPRRASVALLAVTAILVVDQLRWLVPSAPSNGGLFGRAISIERFVLFLGVPLGILVFGFRDAPSRYGLRLGEWRLGAGLLVAGLVAMTPIILALAALPQFREYYRVGTAAPLATIVLDHLVELVPAEFLLRGFLMFALWRRVGPLALVVSLVPFVFTHVGKPEIELWSTFFGGAVFAWLNWRTGSILWSALGHVYVVTLMDVAVGGATL